MSWRDRINGLVNRADKEVGIEEPVHETTSEHAVRVLDKAERTLADAKDVTRLYREMRRAEQVVERR